MPGQRYRRLWFALGLVLALVVLVLSLMPSRFLREPHWGDKVNHMLAYIVMTGWFCGLYARSRWATVVLALVAYGVAVEGLQTVTPFGRSGDWRDLVANAVGITIGLLVSWAGLAAWPRWIETRLLRAERQP